MLRPASAWPQVVEQLIPHPPKVAALLEDAEPDLLALRLPGRALAQAAHHR